MKRFLIHLALIVGFSVLLACPAMGDFSFTGNNTTASFNFSFDGCSGATVISAGGFNGFAEISILSPSYRETISISSLGNFSVSMLLSALGFSESLSISDLGSFTSITSAADFMSILKFHGISATMSKTARTDCDSGNCGDIQVSVTIGGEEIWVFIPEEEEEPEEEPNPPSVEIILRELGFDSEEIRRLIDEFGRSKILCSLFNAEFEYDNAYGFDVDVFYLNLYGYNVLGGVFMSDDGGDPFVYIKVFNGYTGEEVMANPISITFVNVMTFPQDIHHFGCFSYDPELLDENLSENPGYYTYPIPIAAGEDCLGSGCLPQNRLGPVDLMSHALFPSFWNIYIGLPALCSFKEVMLPVVVTNLGEVFPGYPVR